MTGRDDSTSTEETSEFLLGPKAEGALADEERVARFNKLDALLHSADEKIGSNFFDKVKEYELTHAGPRNARIRPDRSLPIGQGSGYRNWTDAKDHEAARLFALDQGIGELDEAYSPTTESTDAAYMSSEYINHAIAQTENLTPELAAQLAYGERFLAMYPELAVATRNGFGFSGITEQVVAELAGVDLDLLQETAVNNLDQSTVSDRFFDEFGKLLDVGTKQIVYASLATLSDKEQEHMLALSAAYFDGLGMSTLEDQISFANWFYQESAAIHARENDNSFWGKMGRTFGKVFTEPANYIQDDIIGSVWNAAADGADAWYRNSLTLEETMAISFGQDVGTSGWATFTGLAGAGIDIFIDPVNIAFIGLSGYKLAKTAAMVDDFANMSRARRVASVGMPFGGKGRAIAAGMPKGLRGRSARIAWAGFGRTQDQIVELAAKKGVFQALADAGTYTAAIEKVPSLSKAPESLVRYMVSMTDPDDIQGFYSAAFKGSLLDPKSPAYDALRVADKTAKDAVSNILRNHPDDISAIDILLADGGDVYHAVPIVSDGGKVGKVATADDLVSGGTVTFLKQSQTRILYADPDTENFEKILAWVKKHTKYRNGGVNVDGTINKQALDAYMRANKYDAAVMNGNVIFENPAKIGSDLSRAVQATDSQSTALKAALQRKQLTRAAVRGSSPTADTNAAWVISDMPVKVESGRESFRSWRRAFGIYDGKEYSDLNFLQRKLRGMQAKMFIDDVPAAIRYGPENVQDGANDLRKLLVQMGVDPDNVRASIDSFLLEPTRENTMRIIQDGAAEIGDHEIALGLMRFFDKSTDTLEYAVIDGENLTTAMSADGRVSLVPLLPSQTSSSLALPDSRALSAHLRRVKRATNRKFTARNRGFGKTKGNRRELIAGFGRRLEGEAKDAFNALDEDDKFAMAYAVVRPAGSSLSDGLGMAAKVGQRSAEAWRGLRNAFSIMMLAWRPMGWVGNELLDNSWRGAMAGTLSFFRHPFASMQGAVDAKRIEQATQNMDAYAAVTRRIVASLDDADTPAQVLSIAANEIPDIRRVVAKADTVDDQIDAVKRYLDFELITSDAASPVARSALASELKRQRKGYAAAKKYRLTGDDVVPEPDWADVSITGWENEFANTYSSASQRHQWQAGVSRHPETLRSYAAAWHSTLSRDVRDPAIRAWLLQLSETMNGGENGSRAARAFVNTAAHDRVRDPIDRMLRHGGIDPNSLSDIEKVDWYFKNKIAPYVEDQFGPLLTAENVKTLRTGKGTANINGAEMVFDLDDKSTIDAIVDAANGTNAPMPRSVVGLVDPRTMFGMKTPNGWRTPIRSYNSWALQKFGHDIPVNLQRRPAYLRTFERYKTQYEKFGMVEKAAEAAAHRKAVEFINKSFFYLEAQTPFLKSMNQILPFFAAQWEIVKAWTWKVPTLTSYGGIGHARMLRSFDHVFNTLRENGLLVPRYSNDGEVEGWNLQFAQTPETQNAVGATVSRAGWLSMAAPILMVEQIAEIWRGTDLDLVPEEINFNFNHPYDFFGKGGGVLPTARMQIGLNPAMAVPAAKLVEALPFTSSAKQVEVDEGMTLDAFVQSDESYDLSLLLVANEGRMVEDGILTQDEAVRLRAATLSATEVDLPEGYELYIPQSSLVGDFINNVLMPYGRTDSLDEATSGFIPNTIKNMFKTFALYTNNGDIDGLTAWLAPPILGPTGRHGLGLAFADASAEVEMRTGAFTRRTDLAEQMIGLEPESEEAYAVQAELEELDDFITGELQANAGSRMFVQTLTSMFVPTNPKMPTENQLLREYYFDGLTTAEQWKQGNPTIMPYSDRSAADAWNMVAAWAADPSGSAAKQEFLQQGGGKTAILSVIAPRTFWGPGGVPPAVLELNDYFEQVESGDRLPLTPDVWSQKYQRLVLQIEKEMAIVEEYGNDPVQQAKGILSDRARYNDLIDGFNSRYDALEWEDELVNDNAYAQHVERNGVASHTDWAARQAEEKIANIDEVLDLIDSELFPNDPQEAKSISGELKGIRNTFYDAIDDYNDEKYAGYEPSPRQKILNDYYQQMGDYWDEVSPLYEQAANAASKEGRDLIYSKIAELNDLEGSAPVVVGGLSLPSPLDYSWNAKTLEVKQATMAVKFDDRADWWTDADVQHFVELYPESERFLPVSAAAKELFRWRRDQEARLATKYALDGELALESASDERKLVEEEWMRQLAEAGEFGVIETIEGWPIERISSFGALDPSLDFLVEGSVALKRQLESMEKSIQSNAGKEAKLNMLNWVNGKMAADPVLAAKLQEFGRTFFDTGLTEVWVPKMMGDYNGRVK